MCTGPPQPPRKPGTLRSRPGLSRTWYPGTFCAPHRYTLCYTWRRITVCSLLSPFFVVEFFDFNFILMCGCVGVMRGGGRGGKTHLSACRGEGAEREAETEVAPGVRVPGTLCAPCERPIGTRVHKACPRAHTCTYSIFFFDTQRHARARALFFCKKETFWTRERIKKKRFTPQHFPAGDLRESLGVAPERVAPAAESCAVRDPPPRPSR